MNNVLETLQKVDLLKVLSMDLNEMGEYLTNEVRLFRNIDDIKLFILDYAAKSLTEDDSIFPIYYDPTEKEYMIDEQYLDTTDEALTDEFIQKNFNE